jgi:hypothetical protein
VEIQAGPLPALFRQSILATPDRVQAANDRQGSPQLANIGIRTEVARSWNVTLPSYQHARKRLPQGYSDGGIALVIFESDVEARSVLLDKVVLEQERTWLARNHDCVHISDEPLKQSVPGAIGKIRGKVTAYPAAESLRLANVKDLSISTLPDVHTGAFRKRIELPLEFVGNSGSGQGHLVTWYLLLQ